MSKMKNTCETCKYWTGKDQYEGGITNPRDPDTFEPMEMPFDVRYCEHPRLMMFERPIERDQASCIDGSEYKAKLACGPDFGCIHHDQGRRRKPHYATRITYETT